VFPKATRLLLILLVAAGVLLFADTAFAGMSPADRRKRAVPAPAEPAGDQVVIPKKREPLIPLTEYQKKWVEDKSRFKIGVITRQGGKSFSTSLEAVLDCVENPGTTWVLLSAGERQSKELINKAKMHMRAINVVLAAIATEETDFLSADGKTVYKQLEINLPNGSRLVGLPANPDTARGWSANILLDEFALHRDSREIWSAMFPTVTRGYKIRMISTFKGKSNKFYEMFFSSPTLQRFIGRDHEMVGERGGWSKHLYSIYDAVKMGLKLKDEEGNLIEPEDLKLALNDDDAWDEEFGCIPSDEVSAFLTHELISSVEDVRLHTTPDWADSLIKKARVLYKQFKETKVRPPLPVEIFEGVQFLGDVYVGMDIGRKRDLSVIWVDQKIKDVLSSMAVIELKAEPFFVQEYVLQTLLEVSGFRRAGIDESGIGAQLAENARDLFGERVECISFTPGNKEALATGLKANFEDRGSLIPPSNTIRNSLHSVKKYATTTKHFRFDAERTDKTGHADHFWAKALAVQAASSGPASTVVDILPVFGEAVA
jgi:phage FluMu gp28-like protein